VFRIVSEEPTPQSTASDSATGAPVLTDATAMRALAHPVRLALIDLFGYHESLTASQASELLGESPTNCAFHLRTLAKYGFLREAPTSSRRERPWALVHRAVRITQRQAEPAAALAAKALVRAMLDRWLEKARHVFGSPCPIPGWQEASGVSQKHVFMTPSEAEAARGEIQQILDRYDDRQATPSRRPPEARPVEWTLFVAPVTEWTPSAASSPHG
jgi:hypothetical protein